MRNKYNTVSFSPEEVTQGLFTKMLNTLMDYNAKSQNYYYDIHITTDSFCTILEFAQIPYSHEWGGNFEYVDEDEVIYKEIAFPDRHYEYVPREENKEEIIKEWLENNPGWEKNNYGNWYNVEEQKEFEKYLAEIEPKKEKTSKKISGEGTLNDELLRN